MSFRHAPAACLLAVVLGLTGCTAAGDSGTPDRADASDADGSGADASDADGSGTNGDTVAAAAGRGDGTCDDAPADAPQVIAVEVTRTDEGFTAAATVCSRYDTPQRYADAWRVVTPDGEVLATRELAHDHANEQPFTRALDGAFEVPAGVATLVVEVRDQRDGWVESSALEIALD